MRISKHCPKCDGQNIYQQSFWTWSKTKQDWQCDDDDVITCPDCAWSGYTIVEKEWNGTEDEDDENV